MNTEVLELPIIDKLELCVRALGWLVTDRATGYIMARPSTTRNLLIFSTSPRPELIFIMITQLKIAVHPVQYETDLWSAYIASHGVTAEDESLSMAVMSCVAMTQWFKEEETKLKWKKY